MSNNFIYLFSQTATLELAGGKGLNLMRLTQAGMPVPPGFVVSTAAYAAFVAFNGLDEQLTAAFAALQKDQSLGEISGRIRSAFEQGEFPVELAQHISEAYRNLGQDELAVAVRSSATAEDLAEASFAGQQDTYLNVRREKEVLDAIRRCFGSLWSERAIYYRARQGLAPLSTQLAVVIQQMVFAEAAGVAFTADPVTGDSNLMVIDAVYGLGEALVSGLVTLDHLVLDKRSGALLSYSIAEKNEQIVSTPDGTQQQPVPRSRQKRRVLNEAQTRMLYQLAQKIEAVYGRPQDLEWCLADGDLYIVQARPITTLPEIAINWQAPGEGQWLHGGGTFEMITEPVSPLFETSLLPIFYQTIVRMLAEIGLEKALPSDPYHVVNGHIYLHMQMHLRPWHLFGVLRDFALHLDSMKGQESEQALYRETVAQLSRPAIDTLSGEQILDRLQALGEAGMRYWLQIMKVVQVIYRQEKAFHDFYQRIRHNDDPEPEIFLRGQKIKPWEAECSTFDLAQLARKLNLAERLLADGDAVLTQPEPDAAISEWHAALEAHLERYGHQLSSFDLSLPTLADDPRPVLAAIRTFLDGKQSPYTRQEQMTSEREQATSVILKRLSQRERAKFTRLLETAQHATRTRENALFEVGLAWTQMHRCALELGRRLTRGGVTSQEANVFWLTVEEIREALASPAERMPFVTERQIHNRAWSKVNAPYLLPVGSRPASWWHWIFPTPELQRHPDAHTLIGLGVSPGKVTGVARVIHSLDEMEQIHPGEILVARTTTPAWTPLFARISGLITDLGGPLAHGSIVAREVGIPAVMGTGNATQKNHSGQVVTILGSEGKVLVN